MERKPAPGYSESAKRYEFQILANQGPFVNGAMLVDRCVIEAGTLAEAVRKYADLFKVSSPDDKR